MKTLFTIGMVVAIFLVASTSVFAGTNQAEVMPIGVDSDCVLPPALETEIDEHRTKPVSVLEREPLFIRSLWLGTMYLEGLFRIVTHNGRETLVIHHIDFGIRVVNGYVVFLYNRSE